MRSVLAAGCFVCLCEVGFLGHASARPCVPAPPPSPYPCDPWDDVTTDYDIVLSTTVTSSVITPWVKGSWVTSQAYHCAYVPSGSVNQPPPALQVQIIRTSTYCWKIGASASLQAKNSLATRLIAELSLTITFTGEYSYCHAITEGLVGYVPQNQCFSNSGRWRKMEHLVAGSTTWADARTYWESDCGHNGVIHMKTYCGISQEQGTADKLVTQEFQIAPPRPECGGSGDFSQYDGKYMEQCCTPLAPCNNPADPPCCGIYGGN